MESKSKKTRKEEEEEEDDLDRLSCLPDSILTHILCYLDTETAVRTSILSKRYRLLWTLSPCLDFKLPNFEFNIDSFQSFVNRVLQFREHTNLEMFRLFVYMFVPLEFVHNCLDYAARHKVRHLRVRGYFKDTTLTLPNCVINSSSLVSLHLHNATVNCIVFPKSVALPNLKVLSLKNFEFSHKNFNSEVFSGCPNLETLVMSKCCIRAVNTLSVDCLKLKNLEIKNWRSPWECFDEHMIDVNAPNLAVFKFIGHLVKVNFKKGLSCLEEACVDLRYPTSCLLVSVSDRKQKISESFLSMLCHMCNVKFLSLSMKAIEVLSVVPDLCGHSSMFFENLRVLKFTAENEYREKTIRIETVSMLLEKSTTDVLIFDDFKEKNVLPETSESKAKKDASASHVSIPAHVMRFLLESSPAMEFLTIEIPNLSSDQE